MVKLRRSQAVQGASAPTGGALPLAGALPRVQETPAPPEEPSGVVRALRGHEAVYGRAQIHTPEFKRWFGKSVVVDASGEPLVVYHGARQGFDRFEISEDGVAYFTPDPAYGFIRGSQTVLPVFVRIENPYWTENLSEVEGAGVWPEWIRGLKAQGYDGIVYAKRGDITRGASGWGDDRPQVAVFSPTHIKSALSNVGAFDPNNPDIRA